MQYMLLLCFWFSWPSSLISLINRPRCLPLFTEYLRFNSEISSDLRRAKCILLHTGSFDSYLVSIRKSTDRGFIQKLVDAVQLLRRYREVYSMECLWEWASQLECQCRLAQLYWSYTDWHLHHSWRMQCWTLPRNNISGNRLIDWSSLFSSFLKIYSNIYIKTIIKKTCMSKTNTAQ